jgi:hypothetical protein
MLRNFASSRSPSFAEQVHTTIVAWWRILCRAEGILVVSSRLRLLGSLNRLAQLPTGPRRRRLNLVRAYRMRLVLKESNLESNCKLLTGQS